VKLVFRDLNNLHLAGRIWIVLWGRHVTKRICTQKEKARGRREERKRDHGRSLEKRFPEWCGFLRFTTFLIVWNSLSTANKERKMSPSPHFHLDRFREHCVTARSVAREHPEVTESWAFSVNNFRLRFYFLITRSLPVFAMSEKNVVPRHRVTLPELTPSVPFLWSPLLRRLRVSRLYSHRAG